jgi:hypothetical protein
MESLTTHQTKLIDFLREDLALPAASIAFAQRHQDQVPNVIAIILWQYGLITLEQLDQIFDWMETAWG